MTKELITRGDVSITLFINTDHEDRLEFVLEEAENRTGTQYIDNLMKMLNATEVKATEYGAYGDVYYTLVANTISELDRHITISAGIVRQWMARYKVNKMLPHKRTQMHAP